MTRSERIGKMAQAAEDRTGPFGEDIVWALNASARTERQAILEALTQVSTAGTPEQVKEWCLAVVRERGEP